ncbi:MutS-related protein [Alkalitalea saponilacus]|uniref:MutS domain III n=1 Tax=Alkalitalea saponilacus TaxID=889453 RepID=A0A1T5HSC9_9BACT|nr:hypothetical protein [Alkalitalea saponilacus]ASB48376.1 hypothetical protein CDL62_04070 [Alkalitalea saponilacus]SKC23608.1 MutS domain III [Alkalitalea saponilacus]
MTQSSMSYYKSRIILLEKETEKLKRRFKFLFFARIGFFLMFLTSLVLFTTRPEAAWLVVLSIISLLIFLRAVVVDLKLVKQQKLLSNRLLVNQRELRVLSYDFADMDEGEDLSSINPHLAGDFDLFGSHSLFQYLNRTITKEGRRKLGEWLCHWSKKEEEILQRQQAVRELSMKSEFLENFQAFGLLNKEVGDEQQKLIKWLNEPESGVKKLRWLLGLYPAGLLVWVGLTIFSVLPASSLWLLVGIGWWLSTRKSKQVQIAHNSLGKSASIFRLYERLLIQIENEDFDASFLKHQKEKLLWNPKKGASFSLKIFFRLLERFDYRHNMIAASILNLLSLFDLQILYRLEKWKEKHRELVPRWLESLNTFDAMIGFARFDFNNQEHVVFPEIATGEFSINAKALGHPLIPHEERVCNDLDMQGQPRILVVTGANMAGKSTFLRTLAVNLILAMNGAPALARSMRFTPCDILSSINIRDSLSHKASYFYAELTRIREIIDHVQSNPKTLVVLDEILRGTNTKDKQAGSIGLLEKMMGLNAVVVIATHDLMIGELEQKYPSVVMNHCFEVELSGDELVFDYKLKNGVSKKLNASFLMKKMGVI